ncbi:U2 snRNP complex subunit, partial [Physocladia obscura]
MKLDYDVLTNALSFIDAAKERCLDLRNLKIARIENLAMTRDLNDTIDLTNNELVVLADFPLLPRLHTLLLSHNRITQIAPTVAPALPNLTNLILSNNQIAELDDLAGLFAFKNLVRAAFVGCPVSAKKNYRLYVISRCKNIRVLDFRRVKDL